MIPRPVKPKPLISLSRTGISRTSIPHFPPPKTGEKKYEHYLGEGSYGIVYLEKEYAVKKMRFIPDIIQEYVSLSYLTDVKNVIKVVGYDLEKLEIRMKYYPTNLRNWMEENPIGESLTQRTSFARDICVGLADLHARGLTHTDVKPSNILLELGDQPRAFLGDLGFVSVSKYVKAELTANIFRDPAPRSSSPHDIFSFGILMLELLGNLPLFSQLEYSELHQKISENIEDEKLRDMIIRMTDSCHENRPTAIQILAEFFEEKYRPTEPFRPMYHIENLTQSFMDDIREQIAVICHENDINRPKRGYHALLEYFNSAGTDPKTVKIHILAMCLILASLFGNPRYDERKILEEFKAEELNVALRALIDNYGVISILMYP